jgi:hypothetical protein
VETRVDHSWLMLLLACPTPWPFQPALSQHDPLFPKPSLAWGELSASHITNLSSTMSWWSG